LIIDFIINALVFSYGDLVNFFLVNAFTNLGFIFHGSDDVQINKIPLLFYFVISSYIDEFMWPEFKLSIQIINGYD